MIEFAGGKIDARSWNALQNVVVLAETSSSNDLAREIIETYFAEEQEFFATVLVGESQTAARGRKGQWLAPAGQGLYLTLVRRLQPGEPLSLVPIAVARWVRDALAGATGLEAGLKWPNDLYAGGRKLAGILAESRTQGDDTYVAVGVGLNALGTSESVGVANATTVESETGGPVALVDLLQAVLDRFDRELAEPVSAAEVERWQSVSLHHPGDVVTVRRDGVEVEGEYRGLTPEGFLRIGTPAGEAVVATGELARW